MFHEAWRIERDFFYDPHHHGLDLDAAERKYRPYVAGVASHDDLRYLLTEAMGELTVGHLFIFGGGDDEGRHPPPTGLLGADFSVDHGHYRITRIYTGESWNPALRAPLSQPGVNVAQGDYLLAVEWDHRQSHGRHLQVFPGHGGAVRRVACLSGSIGCGCPQCDRRPDPERERPSEPRVDQ